MFPKAEVIDGQSFGARVVSPVPVEGAKDLDRKIPDPILEALFAIEAPDEKTRERVQALIAARMAANNQALALIQGDKKRKHAGLIEEHEKLKAECRKQIALIEEIDAQIVDASTIWNERGQTTSAARIALTDAKAQRAETSRLVSRAEIARLEKEIEKAAANLQAAQEEEGTAQAWHQQLILVERPRLKEKLEELKTEELRLYATIEGKGYYELGIMMPARQ